MISRRNFLRSTPLAAATTVSFPHVSQSAERLRARTGQRAKHIIHMVADGMSTGTLTCADHLSRYLRNRFESWWSLSLGLAAQRWKGNGNGRRVSRNQAPGKDREYGEI